MTREQEFSNSTIKREHINFNLVKLETVDTYASIIDSSIFTNCDEDIPEQHKCDICLKVCDDSVDVIIHKCISHVAKPYICPICHAGFVLSAHLKVHLDEHDGGKFLVKSALPINLISSSIDNLTEYSKKLKLSIQSTVKTENVSGKNGCITKLIHKYKCINCKYSSVFQNKYLKHQNICKNNPGNKTKTKMYHCNLCPRAYKNQTSLNGHIKYHSIRGEIISKRQRYRLLKDLKENNGSLNTPNNKTTQNKFIYHTRQHEKQMTCNICNKQFFLKKRFEIHLLQHKNKEQNVSQISLNKNRKSNPKTLGNKMRTYRQCEWCDISISWNNLNRHIKAKHPETRSLKCLHCLITFKDYASLRYHYSEFHKN